MPKFAKMVAFAVPNLALLDENFLVIFKHAEI